MIDKITMMITFLVDKYTELTQMSWPWMLSVNYLEKCPIIGLMQFHSI